MTTVVVHPRLDCLDNGCPRPAEPGRVLCLFHLAVADIDAAMSGLVGSAK